MGDGRGADAALGADEGDGAADRLGFRIDEDRRDNADDIGHRDRRDDIFGNAGADQLAIEPDIVVVADDHDLDGRIAIFGKLRAAARAIRLGSLRDSRMIRFGVGADLVELDRGGDAAHMHLQMGLRHAAVLAGALDRMGDALGLAESLDRDARHRPQRLHGGDVLLRRCRRRRSRLS